MVFDQFQIKKYLNKAINTIRNDELKTVESLKMTKYIWLKNENNLTENQKMQLNNLLKDSSLNTSSAYLLKSDFDQIWDVQKYAVLPFLEK